MPYKDKEFLKNHIEQIVSFYHPVSINKSGGYFHEFFDNGEVGDKLVKHLVGTCRFIYIYSVSYMTTGNKEYLKSAQHGMEFLKNVHKQSGGGFSWLLNGDEILDNTKYCYGHAFVLLAASIYKKANIDNSLEFITEIYNLLENRFWDDSKRLYVDEIKNNWSEIDPYRGQNANMHMCEAMLSSYEATNEDKYLDRAYLLAKRVCVDLTKNTGGLIWEHFTEDWTPDWNYNADDPKHMFKPYGYNLGHSIEWAKLLIILERYRPESWMKEKAEELFAKSMEKSWDNTNGGMIYTLTPDGEILDTDRYYWVLCEAFAASALLGLRTNNQKYWGWYEKIWNYSNKYFIDHEYGGWYRVLNKNNQKYSNIKSPPSKSDYHPIGACFEILEAMRLNDN